MAISSWRGDIGFIKPTLRPGSVEEFIRLLPEGVGVMQTGVGIVDGTVDEFKAKRDAYERCVADLAPREPDVIFCDGAPPFMVHGYAGEAKIIRSWEKTYGVPVCTSGQLQVNVLRALGITKFVGASYFPAKLNRIFADYFTDAGFKVLALEGIDVPFDKVQELSELQVYAHIKKQFLEHGKGADGIYMLGSGWRTLGIVQMLEQDLELPVSHPVCAKVWETQRRLHIREPRAGYGTLLADLPKMPAPKAGRKTKSSSSRRARG